MNRVIPIELEEVFQRIREDNKFTLVDGEVEWSSVWHNDAIQLFDRCRVIDNEGLKLRMSLDGDNYSPSKTSVSPYTPEYPFYHYGSIADVIKMVKSEALQDKNTAFPLAMLETLDEPYTRTSDVDVSYNFIMYLCVRTEAETSTAQRYRESYQDVLLPYWGMIKMYLQYSNYIWDETSEVITFRERWGKNGLYGREGNVFDNMVDALEIRLNLNFKNC